jgi:hypothetical protein
MNPLKNFMEADLGKPMGQSVQATQKFLQKDRQVLRFYCTWEDTSMYGERKPYILHYFLADDTMEVLEVHAPNSGRDNFPAMLKRQRLPRNFRDNAPSVTRIGLQTNDDVEYYVEQDLRIGMMLDVYGRQVLLAGCDEFTKNYYMTELGLTEVDFPQLNMDPPARIVPSMEPPAHNGFGTEEDSLGSFLYLMPKVPKKNFKKLMENDGINLRFLSKFVNPSPEDSERVFIITYYMSDDTVGVYEKFQRNSGFIGGKFLERSRILNPATGDYFTLDDFQFNAQVRLNSYNFLIDGADDYTMKYLQANR